MSTRLAGRASRPIAMLAAVWIAVGRATVALAAEPGGSPATGGDPRSPGQGPGLVGDPVMAIGIVLVVGLLSLALTIGYVRLTDARRHGR